MPDEVINVVIEDQVEQININVNDFSTSKIISTDVGNAAELGTDGGIFVPPSAGGGVTSAFGRTGDVVAEDGDYDTSLVTEVTDKKYVTDSEKLVLANTSGNNTGDQDLSGLEPAFSKNTAFNKNFGSIADTVVEGNDSRMSDSRNPLAHTHTKSDVVGLVADLGNKLDKDISTLPAVSLPLVDSDKLIVNRGGVDYSVDKSEFFKQQYVDVSVSTYTITSADHNKIFRIHTTCTITIPSGLRTDFTCTGLNDNGVVTNFALGVGVTSSTNSDGTTLGSGKMFALIMTNIANTISIKGELI